MRESACPTHAFPLVNDGFRGTMGIEAVETTSLAVSIIIVAVFLKHDYNRCRVFTQPRPEAACHQFSKAVIRAAGVRTLQPFASDKYESDT